MSGIKIVCAIMFMFGAAVFVVFTAGLIAPPLMMLLGIERERRTRRTAATGMLIGFVLAIGFALLIIL